MYSRDRQWTCLQGGPGRGVNLGGSSGSTDNLTSKKFHFLRNEGTRDEYIISLDPPAPTRHPPPPVSRDPMGPQPREPCPMRPQPRKSDPMGPQPREPDPMGPQPGEPDPKGLQLREPGLCLRGLRSLTCA